jgi:hypothetical protein
LRQAYSLAVTCGETTEESGRLDTGIAREGDCPDAEEMIWPVAALAVGLLGFVLAYGSVVQSRLASSRDRRGRS